MSATECVHCKTTESKSWKTKCQDCKERNCSTCTIPHHMNPIRHQEWNREHFNQEHSKLNICLIDGLKYPRINIKTSSLAIWGKFEWNEGDCCSGCVSFGEYHLPSCEFDWCPKCMHASGQCNCIMSIEPDAVKSDYIYVNDRCCDDICDADCKHPDYCSGHCKHDNYYVEQLKDDKLWEKYCYGKVDWGVMDKYLRKKGVDLYLLKQTLQKAKWGKAHTIQEHMDYRSMPNKTPKEESK